MVQAQQAYVPVRATTPAYSDLGDARVVPVRATSTGKTSVHEERRAPVRQTRSVKKSAIIIGSSAGVGAGVGAAVGGKKGALIGAAIGGGGAAIAIRSRAGSSPSSGFTQGARPSGRSGLALVFTCA